MLAGSPANINSTISALDHVNASAISSVSLTALVSNIHYTDLVLQTVSSLLKSKPTFVAVGDIKSLPYADELGL